MRISRKLTYSFILVVAIPLGILALVTTHLINTSMEESAQEAINHNLKAAWIQYYVRGDQMKFGMLQAAAEREIQEAVERGDKDKLMELMNAWKEHRHYVDLWIVVDSEGRVIVRLNSENAGDFLSLNGAVEKAVDSKAPVISTEILPRDILAVNGVFLGSDALEGGMMLLVVTPVVSEGRATGGIITGDLLNGDDFIPAALEEKIPGLKISVIQRDEVISSNIKGEADESPLRPKLSEHVMSQVVQGLRFSGDQEIGGKYYKTAVEGIKNNKGEVIGALFVGVPKERFVLLRESNILAIGLVTLLGLAIASSIAILAAREISRPITSLASATRKIREGDFDVHVAEQRLASRDEIGELAMSFNEMAVKLKQSYNELERLVDERTRELLLLQKVNNLLNSGSRLEVILETIAKGLTSVFEYEISAIHLLNESRTRLVCKSYSADSSLIEKVEQLTGRKALNYEIPLFKGSMLTQLIETKEPIITEDIVALVKSHCDSPALKALAGPIAKISGIKFGIGVPLLAEDKIVGVIGIGSREKLSEKDVERLLNFAKQAGLAVERAKIYEILEDKVQERTKELKESKEFLDSVFNSITDMIFIRDLDHKIIKANKVAEHIFGNVEGKCCYHALMQKSAPCDDCPVEHTLTTGEAVTREFYSGVLKEHLLISTYPIVGEDSKLKAVVESVKVITEKKKLEEQMRQSEKLASIGRLAAGFAHEINNPLTNISLYSQILEHKARGDNRKMLGIIRDQTDVAAKTVKNLLEFSYHHSENYVPVQLNEIIFKALGFMEPHLHKASIEVKLALDSKLSKIRGDESQLQQVFVNILTNAIDAMPKGGILEISTLNNSEYIVAGISDTGCGIPEENLSKLFDPFFTTKEVGEGTGLGLFISYGIIQKHNGAISVKSDLGRGTTFKIQLPKLEKDEGKDSDSR